MNWPKEIQLPDASMIYRGCLDGPDGEHCAVGWLLEWFGPGENLDQAGKVLRDVLKKKTTREVFNWNDSPKTNKNDIALALHETARRLGYE